MFTFYEDLVETIALVHVSCTVITRHDADLARQIRRAVTSVGLNAAEGLHARGGTRRIRLESAMNSGRETIFGLRIAGAVGYLEAARVLREVDEVDHIVAILYKLSRKPG